MNLKNKSEKYPNNRFEISKSTVKSIRISFELNVIFFFEIPCRHIETVPKKRAKEKERGRERDRQSRILSKEEQHLSMQSIVMNIYPKFQERYRHSECILLSNETEYSLIDRKRRRRT